jgi:hypothetical protein
MMNLIEDFIHWLDNGNEIFLGLFIVGSAVSVIFLIVVALMISPVLGVVVGLGICFGVPLAGYVHSRAKRRDH